MCVCVCITCVTPCWPPADTFGTVVRIFPAVPGVTILVVRMVIGLFPPGREELHSVIHHIKH